MPGDRIFVYRDPIVRTTIFIDRLAAPFNTVISSILQYSFTGRSIQYLNNGVNTGGSNATRGGSVSGVPANSPAF
jgi:polysaccharide export outer membrane protein